MVFPHNIHELVADLNTAATAFNNVGGFSALLASGVLSPVGIGIKKLKDIRDGEIMLWIMAGASLIAGFIVYLFSTPQHDPTIIGFLGLVTFIGTQPFYKIVFKPFFAWLGGQFAQAKLQVEADRNPAAVPPEGLPVIGQ